MKRIILFLVEGWKDVSGAILAWVAIILTIGLIILLLSSSWVQFVLDAGVIGLLLYVLIGAPLTWVFFLFRGIYRRSAKWRKSREVAVGLIGVLLTVMIISGVTVAVKYRSDLIQYKFPCSAEGPPSWLDTKAFEVAKQNKTDEFLIALHSLSKEQAHQDSDLSDLILMAQLEKSEDAKKELVERIEREQSRISEHYLESLRTIKSAIDQRFRSECQSAYEYAYRTNQSPELTFGQWAKYRFVK
jgi:hypothetical protein